MGKRWKWVLAFCVTVAVITVSWFEQKGTLQTNVGQITTSGDDFVMLRNWTKQMLKQKEDPSITVTAPNGEKGLSSYETLQSFSSGVLLSYEKPITIRAKSDGLVIFTGHTKSLGKTMTIIYDTGEHVTYGFLDELAILPYTSVTAGDSLSDSGSGTVYLQIERRGAVLDTASLQEWIK